MQVFGFMQINIFAAAEKAGLIDFPEKQALSKVKH